LFNANSKRRADWMEISADYKCNNQCVGCFGVSDGGGSMTTRDILVALKQGRALGAENFWFGGGEPTLRSDMFKVITLAAKTGYKRIKLQTNGLMLAYPKFLKKAVASGLNEVNFSIKGASPKLHDSLTNTPRCHELMVEAIKESKKLGLTLEGDILLYTTNVHELPEMIQTYHALGVERFNLWHFSSVDAGAENLNHLVPTMTELMDSIKKAMDLGLSYRPDFITSFHTPACVIPKDYRTCLFHAPDLNLIVANPGFEGNHYFWLEESPIEGGHYLESCTDCTHRTRCGGIRKEYMEVHGTKEFIPLSLPTGPSGGNSPSRYP